MIDEKALSLNYIKKLPLPGSDAGLRYMLRTEERIPPSDEDEDKAKGEDNGGEQEPVKPMKVLCAYAWPEPLCFAKTDPSLIVSCDFPLTQEGKLQAVEWLEKQRPLFQSV